MATDMMEVDLPISSNPWKIDNLVDDQTDKTTNEKSSTTIPPQPKRQRDNNYSPNESLTVFNNGVLPSSSSSVAPFKNNGGRPDWESLYGWSALPPRDPNLYKLLEGDKAAEYNSIRDRLHTLVKLSVGISDDVRNKAPPLRSDGQYTNQDTAADSFLLLMARLSLNDIPPEQRKEEAKRLLGAVSNMVEDCDDINAFFSGGGGSGGGGGGDLVVPSSTLSTSTGNINSTSDVGVFDSTGAAVPSSCTTSDAIIDSNDDLVLSVTSCPEGNNSSTDDELVLASNSELRTTEEISSMDASPPITNSKVTPLTAAPNNSNNEETPSHQSLQHNNDNGGGAANTTAAVVPELSNSTTAATSTTQIVATKEYIRETVLDIDSVIDVKSYISNAAGVVTNNTYQTDEVEIIKQIQYINSWGFKKDVPMDVILDRISLAEQGYRFFKPGECKCNYMCILYVYQ